MTADSSETWFIADLVEAINVAGHPEVIVHVNKILISAKSSSAAFLKAKELGRQSSMRYKNAAGETVSVRFLGLFQLNLINGDLEDGVELSHERLSVGSLEAAKAMVKNKGALALFRPEKKFDGPDYVDASLMELFMRDVETSRLESESQSGQKKSGGRKPARRQKGRPSED